jgi:hypothetical protein
LAIRFLVDGQASGGSVAISEFDVPAGAKVPAAHSHDAYEETIYGREGVLSRSKLDQTVILSQLKQAATPFGVIVSRKPLFVVC